MSVLVVCITVGQWLVGLVVDNGAVITLVGILLGWVFAGVVFRGLCHPLVLGWWYRGRKDAAGVRPVPGDLVVAGDRSWDSTLVGVVGDDLMVEGDSTRVGFSVAGTGSPEVGFLVVGKSARGESPVVTGVKSGRYIGVGDVVFCPKDLAVSDGYLSPPECYRVVWLDESELGDPGMCMVKCRPTRGGAVTVHMLDELVAFTTGG